MFLRGGYHCGLFTTDTYRFVWSAAPLASETSDLRFLIFAVLLYHVLWAEVELELAEVELELAEVELELENGGSSLYSYLCSLRNGDSSLYSCFITGQGIRSCNIPV